MVSSGRGTRLTLIFPALHEGQGRVVTSCYVQQIGQIELGRGTSDQGRSAD